MEESKSETIAEIGQNDILGVKIPITQPSEVYFYAILQPDVISSSQGTKWSASRVNPRASYLKG